MKIVAVCQRYDYGIKEKGDSLDYIGLYPSLKEITDESYFFWYDEYLHDKDKLQNQLVAFVKKIKPDIVYFSLMKDEFSFETLDYLRENYITINWFGDDHWRFENFTQYYAPHFTYSITTDKYSLVKYQNIGYENAILSQWATFSKYDNIDFNSVTYKYDISFVGGASDYRCWLIGELLKSGINVECFGWGWKNGRISFEEMKEIFLTSKINLNISNSISNDIRYVLSSPKCIGKYLFSKKRVEQIKARNFEIPSFGGFQLTNYAPSLEDYFNIGNEIAIYTNPDDLKLQIEFYLQNEVERKRIMISGYKRSKDGNLYSSRLKKIFERISKECRI